jgi:hypothetical protein
MRHLHNIINSTVTLKSGMYILRLVKQPTVTGQSISINPAPVISSGKTLFFTHTGVKNNCLSNAEDIIIVRVDSEEATLLVAENNQGQSALQLKIDKIANLSEKKQALSNEQKKTLPNKNLSKPENIQLNGHIEWKGNVQTKNDEYLGNPKSKNRLEGFAIQWENRPNDIDLAYSCEIEQMGRTPISLSGGFVGTRQRALAIHSISLTLVGLQAKNYTLSGYAIFADQEPLAIISGIDSHGPTVKEPLIALQVIITPKK